MKGVALTAALQVVHSFLVVVHWLLQVALGRLIIDLRVCTFITLRKATIKSFEVITVVLVANRQLCLVS